jgi:hypothetical protein
MPDPDDQDEHGAIEKMAKNAMAAACIPGVVIRPDRERLPEHR